MKQITFCLLMSLTLLFFTSCRDDLMKLHNSNDGNLTVSVEVKRSLYEGEFIKDGNGRFVGPTSENIRLSYIVGSKEYSASIDFEIIENSENMSGTVILTGLPTGVDGTVNVSTFNALGEILCDGKEEMVLRSGDNQVTITLSISDLCPYLLSAETAEYFSEILEPDEVLYVKLSDLVSNAKYEMYIYQEIESPEPPEITIITGSGEPINLLEITESDFGGWEFTIPAETEEAVVCFYNPHNYSVPGLIWIDRPSEYSNVSYNTAHGDLDSNAKYRRNIVGLGKVFATDQESSWSFADSGGLIETVDYGLNWTLYPLIANSLGTDPNYPARVADIHYRNGLVYCLINQRLTNSTAPPFDDIGVAVYNASDGTASQLYSTWDSTGTEQNSPIENYRIAVSETTVFAAYLTAANVLNLLAGSTPDSPDKGTLSTAGFSSNPSKIDEMQICALGDDLYIYADINIYKWTAGSASLDLVFSLNNGTSNEFRYLSVFQNKYIVASNALESSLYIPELNTAFPLVDFDELQSYVNPAFYTISQAVAASENYISFLSVIRNVGDSSIANISLKVHGNGGYQNIGEAVITSGLPVEMSEDFILKKVFMDESTGRVFFSGIDDPEGYAYVLYTFDLN